MNEGFVEEEVTVDADFLRYPKDLIVLGFAGNYQAEIALYLRKDVCILDMNDFDLIVHNLFNVSFENIICYTAKLRHKWLRQQLLECVEDNVRKVVVLNIKQPSEINELQKVSRHHLFQISQGNPSMDIHNLCITSLQGLHECLDTLILLH